MKLTYSQTSDLKLVSFPKEIILTNTDTVIFTTWVRKLREAIMESNGIQPINKGNEMRWRRTQLTAIRNGVKQKQTPSSSTFLQFNSRDRHAGYYSNTTLQQQKPKDLYDIQV
jgi:hypothetical protein